MKTKEKHFSSSLYSFAEEEITFICLSSPHFNLNNTKHETGTLSFSETERDPNSTLSKNK